MHTGRPTANAGVPYVVGAPTKTMKTLPAAALLGSLLLTACGPSTPDGPNILLITLDTTRADHLGCYGYSRATSPHLDALAEEGVVFDRAYAVSSWTMPTHASLFTAKFPSAHGAHYNPNGALKLTQGLNNPGFDHYRANPIAENEITLATILAQEGYATGGVVAGPWMKTPFRLNRGFQFYDDENITELNGRDAEDLTKVAKGFIDENGSRPFFLFLNYYDAHNPFMPRAEYLKAFADLSPAYWSGFQKIRDQKEMDPGERKAVSNAWYDSEIAYVDRFLGELFDHLRARGVYDDTWIIVTADHGELMGDPILSQSDLYGHGNSLSEAEIRIPLIVKYPAKAGQPAPVGRDDTPVQQIDVMPTILAGLGIELPEVLTEVMQGNPFEHQNRPVFAEVYPLPLMNATGKDWRHKGFWRILIDKNQKYVWGSEGRNYLIDLEKDPGERVNLLQPGSDQDRLMARRIETLLKRLPEPGMVGDVEDLPDDVMRQLEGLGYIGDD